MSSKQSEVTLYSGVPLSPTYDHSVYFSSASAQVSGLADFRITTASALSYVRVTDGYVNFPSSIDNGMTNRCNYLKISNVGTSVNIYGFVTSIEQINDGVIQIKFDIDFIQTYLIQGLVSLAPCFVERTHVTDDTIGLHTLPEPVETGQAYNFRRNVSNFNRAENLVLMITAPFAWISGSQSITESYSTTVGGQDVNGSYYPITSTLWNNSFTLDNAGMTDCEAFLTKCAIENRLDQIVQATVQPRFMSKSLVQYTLNQSGTLNGHTVRNNKLYTYPYNYLKVDNSHGSELLLKYEDFKNNMCQFYYFNGGDYLGCNATLHPIGYEFSATNTDERTDLSLALPPYPQIPIVGNTFLQWFANQVPGMVGNLGSTLVSAATGAAIGGGAGAVAGAGLSIANSMINFASTAAKEAMSGKAVYGSATSAVGDLVSGKYEFGFSRMHLRRDVYEAIDSFFDVYGYNVSKIMSIRLNARATHTFIKTSNCSISRNNTAPRQAVSAIISAFNSGITFWNGFGSYGNYSVANSIL